MTKEARISKARTGNPGIIPADLTFGRRHSLDIRHSGFVICTPLEGIRLRIAFPERPSMLRTIDKANSVS